MRIYVQGKPAEGKSTVARLIAEVLEQQGWEVTWQDPDGEPRMGAEHQLRLASLRMEKLQIAIQSGNEAAKSAVSKAAAEFAAILRPKVQAEPLHAFRAQLTVTNTAFNPTQVRVFEKEALLLPFKPEVHSCSFVELPVSIGNQEHLLVQVTGSVLAEAQERVLIKLATHVLDTRTDWVVPFLRDGWRLYDVDPFAKVSLYLRELPQNADFRELRKLYAAEGQPTIPIEVKDETGKVRGAGGSDGAGSDEQTAGGGAG